MQETAGNYYKAFNFKSFRSSTAIATEQLGEQKERLTEGDKKAWLASRCNVALGSDAFFPFSDNIKRAFASGVKYIAEPGGSIRDDLVIEECNKKGMVMAITGMRLFHH